MARWEMEEDEICREFIELFKAPETMVEL